MKRTGGQIIVDMLRINQCDRIFCVPGESFLPILDALVDAPEIHLVMARQEGGAAMMAEADAKLTGRPGVAIVTRGPGAANAYSGVHVAAQDSTPLVLLVGLIDTGHEGREAFQEIDIAAMFGDQAKWAAKVDDVARVPEFFNRAWATALSGRPGPVVLGLPENMLQDMCDTGTAPEPAVAVAGHPGTAELDRLEQMLTAAERPLILAGGEYWHAGDPELLRTISETWDVPVSCAFRCQDRFPNTHPHYAGDAGLGINPALAQRIRDADLLIAIGPRLGDCTTSGYTLFPSPVTGRKLVHIHPDPEELSRVYQPTLGIVASPHSFLTDFAPRPGASSGARRDWTSAAQADYRAWTDVATSVPGTFNPGEAVIWLRENLPGDAILTNGAGNYSTWLHRFYRHSAYRTQLAPTSGSMGYGLPAGIAACLRFPERRTVIFAGDGCLQMTCQEFGTIAQYGLKPIVLIVNNGMYGTIRMHQEKHYPGRVSGTSLVNPDFTTLARAYGLHAERLDETAQFPDAMTRALAADQATVLELVTDPRSLTPTKAL